MDRQRLANVEIEMDPESAELPGEELLVDVLRRMLGPGWDIASWNSVAPRVDEHGRHFYRLEFVFTPDNRTPDERRADAAEAART
jgi:hypothetical protein